MTTEQILICIATGVALGIVFGTIAIYLLIRGGIKIVKKNAIKKILAEDKSFYDGLNYQKHNDLKADMQKQLVKAGKLDPKDVIKSTPPHATILEHKGKDEKIKPVPIKKPTKNKKTLPIIKPIKGGK